MCMSFVLAWSHGPHLTRSHDRLTLQAPCVHTDLGHTASTYCAPATWNSSQSSQRLNTLIPYYFIIVYPLLFYPVLVTCIC